MRKSYLAGIVASICLAMVNIGAAIVESIDRSLRWIFAAAPKQPALAFAGIDQSSLAPQPGDHPISASLYQHNRHEAHSHAKAALRGV